MYISIHQIFVHRSFIPSTPHSVNDRNGVVILLCSAGMAPPRKKAKTGLSHDEIWDDSALIQSWDDALEEYQVGVTTA